MIFTPFNIAGIEIPNRLMVTSMVANYCGDDGIVNDRFIRYFEQKASGGYGLIMSEALVVSEDGKGFKGEAGIYNDNQIEGLTCLTGTIHKYQSKTFAQLIHAGRQTARAINNGLQPIAPSSVPCPVRKEMPREMSLTDIERVVADFASAAKRAKAASTVHCYNGN